MQARLSRITVADILELSLDQQARLDRFVNRSPNGRPLDTADLIAMVEMKLGRKVRPGRRRRKPHAEGWIIVPVVPRARTIPHDPDRRAAGRALSLAAL